MGWGGAIDRIGGMIDGLFGLSPEQRKVKLRNQIDKLERKRSEILKEKATIDRACVLDNTDRELRRLRSELGNQ